MADGQYGNINGYLSIFPNVAEAGTNSAFIPIQAITLVRSMQDDNGCHIRFDLKDGKFILVGCESEEDMQERLTDIQKSIGKFWESRHY